ncbi:MAG TPA: sigma-70 family RNA polymerase sigma factor [Enhygromyxa sp.]|nr:sigma-70 family RNA polymerase sigma factor [Enhygromyxa sp.]
MTPAGPTRRDDFELLEAWRAGDEIAGNTLVRRHFSSVYRFFRSKLDEQVEDLTQQVLLALVESRERVRGPANFRAYLFGIARKTLMMHLRGRYRADKVFSPTDQSIHELAITDASLGEQLAARREQRLLVAALRSIPVDFQIVVELYYWEELSVAEIAEITEVAPGTVKSRLSRARTMLQTQLDRLARAYGIETTGEAVEHWVSSIRDLYSRRIRS